MYPDNTLRVAGLSVTPALPSERLRGKTDPEALWGYYRGLLALSLALRPSSVAVWQLRQAAALAATWRELITAGADLPALCEGRLYPDVSEAGIPPVTDLRTADLAVAAKTAASRVAGRVQLRGAAATEALRAQIDIFDSLLAKYRALENMAALGVPPWDLIRSITSEWLSANYLNRASSIGDEVGVPLRALAARAGMFALDLRFSLEAKVLLRLDTAEYFPEGIVPRFVWSGMTLTRITFYRGDEIIRPELLGIVSGDYVMINGRAPGEGGFVAVTVADEYVSLSLTLEEPAHTIEIVSLAARTLSQYLRPLRMNTAIVSAADPRVTNIGAAVRASLARTEAGIIYSTIQTVLAGFAALGVDATGNTTATRLQLAIPPAESSSGAMVTAALLLFTTPGSIYAIAAQDVALARTLLQELDAAGFDRAASLLRQGNLMAVLSLSAEQASYAGAVQMAIRMAE